MKNRLVFIWAAAVLCCLPFAGKAQVSVDETHFPDSVFRDYVRENFDRDKSGTLSQEECEAVMKIDVSGEFDSPSPLADLTGVEYFPALTELRCFYTELAMLDISRNPALTYLDCSNTRLEDLDVSRNTALKKLYCNDIGLTSLDVAQDTLLEILYCCNTDLTSLDLSRNPALNLLDCSNTGLTDLDVSRNPALVKLYCGETGLTDLDVSRNPALEHLNCSKTELTRLDVSQNPALKVLVCSHTGLTGLDLSKNPALLQLECAYVDLRDLDLGRNPALQQLDCSHTGLTNLEPGRNPALKNLRCDYTDLKILDVSRNPALEVLDCSYTSLTSLDVNGNPDLTVLRCYGSRGEVAAEVGGTYNLDRLPGFDPDRASDWKGGNVEGNVLTFDDTAVTYRYAVLYGDGDKTVPETLEFKLVPNPDLGVLQVAFSPASGSSVKKGDTVRLTCATEDAGIYYGLGRDAEPVEEYTAATAIVIREDTTYIAAWSMIEGQDTSGMVKAVYYVRDEPEPSDTLEVVLPSELEAQVDGQTVELAWKSENGYVYQVCVAGNGMEDTVGKEVESEGERTGCMLSGLKNGTYSWAVRVVRVDGTDTLSPYVNGKDFEVEIASSESAGLSGVRVYPNPTAGAFSLEVRQAVRLEIFTASGNRILHREIETGTQHLELVGSGLYLLRLTAADGRSYLKRLVVR